MIGNGYEVYTISADGPEVKEVLKEGVQHISVPFTRQITPVHDLVCLFRLVRIIKKLRPDIIHTHTPKAGLLGMVAGWICNVPVRMHTVAGLPLMVTNGFRRRLLTFTERITCSCAQRIYPNSSGLQKFLVDDLGIPASKVKMIGRGSSNGIDTAFFSRTPDLERQALAIRTQHSINEGDVVFSFVGRIVLDKGIIELVDAFKAVAEKLESQKRIILLLVGTFEQDLDPLPPSIVKFLREDPRVILSGFQSDVRPWLMASDVFVFPSHREGFPNVVMQACLLGVPCIVSDINGCNEIISDRVTGRIVPVQRVEVLAEAMLELVSDLPGCKRMAIAAQSFVASNFGREYVWKELLKEYKVSL